MALTTEFKPLALDELRREAAVLKADGWRFMQTHAVNGDDGIDLYYSFMKDGHAVNYRIAGVKKDQPVPSITDLFLAAFVFENESRELFGVDMRDIALDFQGAMYAPAESEPMTFITPEHKAAKEKAAKVAAAKAAKAASGDVAAHADASASGKRVFVMTPELQARLDAKLPTLSEEKKAKVEAALKARAEEAQAAADKAGASAGGGTAGESACAAKTEGQAPDQNDSPSSADKQPAPGSAAVPEEPPVERFADDEVEALLGLMGDEAAAKVKAALEGKGDN